MIFSRRTLGILSGVSENSFAFGVISSGFYSNCSFYTLVLA